MIKETLKKVLESFKKNIYNIITNLSIDVTQKVTIKTYSLIDLAVSVILEYLLNGLIQEFDSNPYKKMLIVNSFEKNKLGLSTIVRDEIKNILNNNKDMEFKDLLISFAQGIDDNFIGIFFSNLDIEMSKEKKVLINWAIVRQSLESQKSQLIYIRTYLHSLLKKMLPIDYVQSLLYKILNIYRKYVHDAEELDIDLRNRFISYVSSLKRVSDNTPVLKEKIEEMRKAIGKNDSNVAEIFMALSNHQKIISGVSRMYIPANRLHDEETANLVFYNYTKINNNLEELVKILSEYTEDYQKANDIFKIVFGSAKLEEDLRPFLVNYKEFELQDVVNIENKIEETIEQLDVDNVATKMENILKEFDKGALFNLKNLIFKKVSNNNIDIDSKISECLMYYDNCIKKMEDFSDKCEIIIKDLKEIEGIYMEMENESNVEENIHEPELALAVAKNKALNKKADFFSFKTNFYEISQKLYLEIKDLFNIMYQNMYKKNILWNAENFEKELKNTIADYFQRDLKHLFKSGLESIIKEFEIKVESAKDRLISASIPNYDFIISVLKRIKDMSTSGYEDAIKKIAATTGKYSFGPIKVEKKIRVIIDDKKFFELFSAQIDARKSEIIEELNNIFNKKGEEIYYKIKEKLEVIINFTTFIKLNAFRDYESFFLYLDSLIDLADKFNNKLDELVEKYKKGDTNISYEKGPILSFGAYLSQIGVISVEYYLYKKNNESLQDYINRTDILKKEVERFKDNIVKFLNFIKSFNIEKIFDDINNIDENYNLSPIGGASSTIKNKLEDRFNEILKDNVLIKKIYDDFRSNNNIGSSLNIEKDIKKEIENILVNNKSIDNKIVNIDDALKGKKIDINESNIAVAILTNCLYKIVSNSVYKQDLMNFFNNAGSLRPEDLKQIRNLIYMDNSFEYIREIYEVALMPTKEQTEKILNDIRNFVKTNKLKKMVWHMIGAMPINKKKSSFEYSDINMIIEEMVTSIANAILSFVNECYVQAFDSYYDLIKNVQPKEQEKDSRTQRIYNDQDRENQMDYDQNISPFNQFSLSYAAKLKNNVIKKIAYLTPNYEWYKDYDLSSNRLNILNINKEKFLIVSKEKFEPGEQVIIDNGVFQKEAIIAENIDNYKYKVYIDGLEDVVSVMQIKKIRRQKNG